MITPSHPIADGATFVVSVHYVGRPGTHLDGDGSTEGWFRSDTPPGDGGFVTTEPVGTEDWMPLNDHPSAKASYDFYDTVNAGKTAIGNGILVSSRHNKPDANFPAGSTSWHWRMSFAGGQLPGGEQRRLLPPDRAHRGQRHALLPGPVQLAESRAAAGQPGDHGAAAGHHPLPEPVQRAVPVPLGRRADRHPGRRLRGGDADR